MKSEQQSLIIRILQLGFGCGLTHRYECVMFYINSFPEEREQAIAAFAAFERGCSFSTEGHAKLSEMTDAEIFGYVERFKKIAA